MILCNGGLFIHINKNAGTSVRRLITENAKCSYIAQIYKPKGHLRDKANQFHPHYNPLWIKDQLGDRAFNALWKFCFVRNPWDRFVSWYSWRKSYESRHGRSFKDFLNHILIVRPKDEQRTMPTQSMYFTDPSIYQFVGKVESFADDWKFVCDTLSIPFSTLQTNKSVHSQYQDFYDTESRDLVAEQEKFILDNFHYEF